MSQTFNNFLVQVNSSDFYIGDNKQFEKSNLVIVLGITVIGRVLKRDLDTHHDWLVCVFELEQSCAWYNPVSSLIESLCPPHWGVDILFLLFPPSTSHFGFQTF